MTETQQMTYSAAKKYLATNRKFEFRFGTDPIVEYTVYIEDNNVGTFIKLQLDEDSTGEGVGKLLIQKSYTDRNEAISDMLRIAFKIMYDVDIDENGEEIA